MAGEAGSGQSNTGLSNTGLSGMGAVVRRLGIVVFAAMVALMGAHALQRSHQVKYKGVSPSSVTSMLRGEVDFTKPKLAGQVDERAALKREHKDETRKSVKETLRGWVDQLLK